MARIINLQYPEGLLYTGYQKINESVLPKLQVCESCGDLIEPRWWLSIQVYNDFQFYCSTHCMQRNKRIISNYAFN
jgi:hypothetical protein